VEKFALLRCEFLFRQNACVPQFAEFFELLEDLVLIVRFEVDP